MAKKKTIQKKLTTKKSAAKKTASQKLSRKKSTEKKVSTKSSKKKSGKIKPAGLYANIHKAQLRAKKGGKKVRAKGDKGAPSAASFKKAARTAKS